MIICRKCQRHHADNVGAGPCACGADLRRDGISLVQNVEASPFDDGALDELPPLEQELPALEDSGTSMPAAPAAPVPPTLSPSPAPPPAAGPGAPPPAPTPAPEPPPPPPSGQAAEDSASALKGRRRRARSVKPKTAPPAAPPAGASPAGSTPQAPSVPPTSSMRSTPASGAPTPPPPSPAPGPPDVPQVVSADAATPAARPAVPEEPSKRARSVNPKDLLAAKQDADAPNVGEAPPPGTGSGAAAAPGRTVTTEMDPTPPPPKAGERACPECFEPNSETRRFCVNCGTTLPEIDVLEEEPDEAGAAPKQGLLKRFKRGGRGRGAPGGGGMGGRAKGMAQHQAKRQARRALPQGMQRQGQIAGSWAQRAKAVGGGGRMKYGSGLSGKSKLKLGVAVLAVLVAIVAVAGPGRGRVMALVGGGDPAGVSPAEAKLFGHRSATFDENGDTSASDEDGDEEDEEDEETEETEEGSEGEGSEGEDQTGGGEIAAFPASAAIDEDNETGAGIPWDLEDPPKAGIIVTLEEPMRVRRILIAPGLPDSVEDGPLVLRPKQLQVCSDTKQCDEVLLDDSTSLQKHTLDLGEDVSTVRVTVLDVYVPDHKTYDMAVIGEVRID